MKALATFLAAAALVGAIGGGAAWVHARATEQERGRWELAIKNQKEKAKEELAEAKAETKTAEEALKAFQAAQKEKDSAANSEISRLSSQLLAAGRLRDPNAPGRGSSCPPAADPSPAGTGPGDGGRTEADGLLSVQLSELLLARLLEADTGNSAYASCRADARKLRKILAGLNAGR